MSPPPGKSVGAVSGAGPCARTGAAPNKAVSNSAAGIARLEQTERRKFTNFSSGKANESQAHVSVKPGADGGQTRRAEV